MLMQNLDLFGEAPKRRDTTVDALGFLVKYAKLSKGQPFSSEDVTLAAMAVGVFFDDARSWGAVFIQAAREGYIRRSEVLFRRAMGNGSLSPGWVSV